MKKFILLAVMAVAGISLAIAQPRAVGVNVGYGVDFSYQHNVGPKNMVDLSVNVPAFHGIGATCTYDWVDPFNTSIPWNQKGEWHWAMGVGAGAGYYWPRTVGAEGDVIYHSASALYVGVAGHIGVAYDFWFPMELSLDWRPNVGPTMVFDNNQVAAAYNTGGLYNGITLGIRYKF